MIVLKIVFSVMVPIHNTVSSVNRAMDCKTENASDVETLTSMDVITTDIV